MNKFRKGSPLRVINYRDGVEYQWKGRPLNFAVLQGLPIIGARIVGSDNDPVIASSIYRPYNWARQFIETRKIPKLAVIIGGTGDIYTTEGLREKTLTSTENNEVFFYESGGTYLTGPGSILFPVETQTIVDNTTSSFDAQIDNDPEYEDYTVNIEWHLDIPRYDNTGYEGKELLAIIFFVITQPGSVSGGPEDPGHDGETEYNVTGETSNSLIMAYSQPVFTFNEDTEEFEFVKLETTMEVMEEAKTKVIEGFQQIFNSSIYQRLQVKVIIQEETGTTALEDPDEEAAYIAFSEEYRALAISIVNDIASAIDADVVIFSRDSFDIDDGYDPSSDDIEQVIADIVNQFYTV